MIMSLHPPEHSSHVLGLYNTSEQYATGEEGLPHGEEGQPTEGRTSPTERRTSPTENTANGHVHGGEGNERIDPKERFGAQYRLTTAYRRGTQKYAPGLNWSISTMKEVLLPPGA